MGYTEAQLFAKWARTSRYDTRGREIDALELVQREYEEEYP